MICSSVGDLPVTSPTTSATEASPQVSSSDCCTQYLAAASGSPYMPLAIVVAPAGGLPLAVGADVTARTDGGAELHADIDEIPATPMQKLTTAVRTVDANRESNIFPRKDRSGNLLISKIAPSANVRRGIRHNYNRGFSAPPVRSGNSA